MFYIHITTLFMLSRVAETVFPLAILHLEGPSASADVCAIYNPRFSSIPTKFDLTPKYRVYEPSPRDGCSPYLETHKSWNSSSFVTSTGNCSQFEKFRNAHYGNAKQVIVINRGGAMEAFEKGTSYEYSQVHLSVGMITEHAWEEVKSVGWPMYSQLYHPHESLFDPNIVVIWFLAVFTVCTGAYWCGLTLQESGKKVIEQNFFGMDWTEDKTKESLGEDGSEESSQEEEDNFPITGVMVGVFVLMICSVLLLLYFFYKYLIYVVIALFAFASINGMYECLSKLVSFIPYGECRVGENRLPYLNKQPPVRNVLLFITCVCISIFWLIIRNHKWAWLLQDFMGICFCIALVKTIKLPNLKISAMLLMALLVYDIFFVFITPLFSAHGKSVMVEVATGNGNSEQLPMVIKVPKLSKSVLTLCERPYSLLGFGDILLPGLFVAFCHNFDVIARTKYKVYFLATSIAYGLGLIGTFVALMLMKVGQPALLYLAPSVLLAAIFVGVARGEMKYLWRGRVPEHHHHHHHHKEASVNEDANEQQSLLTPP